MPTPRKRAAPRKTGHRTPDPIDIDPDDFDAPMVIPAVVNAQAQMRHGGGAIPAQIIGDDRDTWQRRLIFAAVAVIAIVLLAGIVRSVYEQNTRLHTAERERTDLIKTIHSLVTDVNNNSSDLRSMRAVLERQNAILKAAGLTPATIPSLRSGGGGASTIGGQSSTPRSQPSSSGGAPPSSSGSSHNPSPRPRPSPSPTRSAAPAPSPTPVIQICVPGLPCIRPGLALANSAYEAVPWGYSHLWRATL